MIRITVEKECSKCGKVHGYRKQLTDIELTVNPEGDIEMDTCNSVLEAARKSAAECCPQLSNLLVFPAVVN